MSAEAISTHLLCTVLNETEDEIEEDKVPNTPASIEGQSPSLPHCIAFLIFPHLQINLFAAIIKKRGGN